MQNRPGACSLCRWGYKTVGYCPTFVGSDPKLSLLFPFPDSEEVVSREALDSARGRRFLHEYCEPYGLEKKNLIISFVLRCLGPWDKKTKQRSYPSSKMRENAEAICRKYDSLHGLRGDLVTGGIVGWSPDLYIFSFDPTDTIRVPSYTRLIQRCMEKGMHFANLGFKPCVLFGEEAVALQCPFVKTAGGLKAWAGGYLEQPWRTLTDPDYEAKKSLFLRGK